MKASLILAAALATLSTAITAADPPWRHVGGAGARQFVLVSPALAIDDAAMAKAAEAVCPPAAPCVVLFWSDPSAVPAGMPMSSAQRNAVIAQYLRNPTSGRAEFMRRCRGGEGAGVKCLH